MRTTPSSDKTEKTMKRSHVVPVILLSKSVVGASAVAFPRYFAVLGWPLALATLLALAAATVASTEVVLGAMHDSRSGSYAGAVKATLEEGKARSESEDEGGGGRGRGRGRSGSRGFTRFLSRSSLPSLALEVSGTSFSFGLLCVYNIVVADISVGERRADIGGGGGGGGGGLLCPLLPLAAAGGDKTPPSFSSFFCSRPRFSFLLNALVLVPLSLRRAARDSKVPSAVGILSLLAWAAATAALCCCAWLGGTLRAPAAVPDWGAIAAAPPLPPPSPAPAPAPPPPPGLFACVVGLAREAGLPTSGLVCQLTAPFVVGGLNQASPREAALVVREAGLLSAAVYALLGLGANALFGSDAIEANVLSNWRPEALAAAVPWLFGGGGESVLSSQPRAAARVLSGLVRLSVAASLVTMYPLLMFPCRDGALRLWTRLLRKDEGEKEEEEHAGGEAEQRLLADEGERGEGGEERTTPTAATGETAAAAAAAAAMTRTAFPPPPSASSHAAATLLLASGAALASLSSGDSAFDVLRLTGATAGAAVSYELPALMALARGRRAVAAVLAAVGAVMIGTAF